MNYWKASNNGFFLVLETIASIYNIKENKDEDSEEYPYEFDIQYKNKEELQTLQYETLEEANLDRDSLILALEVYLSKEN